MAGMPPNCSVSAEEGSTPLLKATVKPVLAKQIDSSAILNDKRYITIFRVHQSVLV